MHDPCRMVWSVVSFSFVGFEVQDKGNSHLLKF